MANSFYRNLLSPKIRFEKIKSLSSIKQLKDEEGFTLVELIVVVMMIGILSSIAIPQFMTAADKAKQKEATGIVSALVKAATAYQTEYGSPFGLANTWNCGSVSVPSFLNETA